MFPLRIHTQHFFHEEEKVITKAERKETLSCKDKNKKVCNHNSLSEDPISNFLLSNLLYGTQLKQWEKCLSTSWKFTVMKLIWSMWQLWVMQLSWREHHAKITDTNWMMVKASKITKTYDQENIECMSTWSPTLANGNKCDNLGVNKKKV